MGGIARHVIDLSHWLRAAGHTVLIAGGPDALLGATKDDQFLTVPLTTVSAKGGSLAARLMSLVRCAAILRGHLRRHPVDLIHCHESAPALVARLASLGMGIPIAVTYHGSEPERVRAFGRVASFADVVITPSVLSAEDLHARGGVPRSKLRVLGLGIKPAPEVDEREVSRLRAEILGQEGRLLVVVLARASFQKGLDILIDVVRELRRHRTDVRFVVAGAGSLLESLRALSQEKGVDGDLRFVGATHQPYLYLRAADLFLLTSRWEALPISIVEAFRARLPVVVSDTGGVRELVDSNVGAVVPVGDVQACVRELLRLCGDPRLRASLAAAAAERSREDRFDPDTVHRSFERLYLEMTALRSLT